MNAPNITTTSTRLVLQLTTLTIRFHSSDNDTTTIQYQEILEIICLGDQRIRITAMQKRYHKLEIIEQRVP